MDDQSAAGAVGSAANLTIEGFHRTDDTGYSISFTTLCDAEKLRNHLRSEQQVFGTYDADPVVLLLDTDGHLPGGYGGTVAVFGDDQRRWKTLQRAVNALQAVLAGLHGAVHEDEEKDEGK